MIKRLARHSATHFLLLGALAFAVVLHWPQGQGAVETISISRAEVDALRLRESERLGRPVLDAEFKSALNAYTDDSILLQRAFDLGLDRDNPAVENRLLRLLDFLDEDIDGTAAQKLMHARSLGLDRSDPMIRRILIEAVRFLISRPAPADLPGEGEIADYYRQHAQRFGGEARWKISQVFFSNSRRDAQRRLEEFRSGKLNEAALLAAGDAFMEGGQLGPLSLTGIRAKFGADFGAAMSELPTDAWQGPLASPYGWHLVKLAPVAERAPAPLQQVQNRIVHELLRLRGETRLRQRMAELRSLYAVRLETGS